MGDEVLRISLLVQRGYLCKQCGVEIDRKLHGEPRLCDRCENDRLSAFDDGKNLLTNSKCSD